MSDRAVYANANALDLPIAAKSVHMIAPSPPYFGLRSYDTGDNKHAERGTEKLHDCLAWARGDEPCDECFVCHMRTWAREMWRVLRDDGVMFLNIGDSYANDGKWGGTTGGKHTKGLHGESIGRGKRHTGLKPKDLCGIPWRRVVDKSEPVNAPTCDHDAPPVPAIVLDPFAGSGTTLMVARKLGRVGLGFDLSYTYLDESARTRLGHDKLAAWGNGIKDGGSYDGDALPLFAHANGAVR